MVTAVGEAAWAAMAGQAKVLHRQALQALSPMLILAPHADDETLGCGGLIATTCALGLRPRIVYLTDGGASHTGSSAWPRPRLTQRRRREALWALGVLGAQEADVLFLDWPDAAPYSVGSADYELSLQRLLDWSGSFSPASLWAPFRGETHCDHQAANALALDLARRLPHPVTVMEFIVWGWADASLASSHGADCVWGLPCADHIALRGEALAQHATQRGGVITDAEQAFSISPELAALTQRPAEIFLERRS